MTFYFTEEEKNRFSVLEKYFRNVSFYRDENSFLEFYSRKGIVEGMAWCLENVDEFDEDTFAYCAIGGHLEAIKWLRQEGYVWNEKATNWAVLGGHLEVIKWFRKEGGPWSWRAIALARYKNRLDIVKLLDFQPDPA